MAKKNTRTPVLKGVPRVVASKPKFDTSAIERLTKAIDEVADTLPDTPADRLVSAIADGFEQVARALEEVQNLFDDYEATP